LAPVDGKLLAPTEPDDVIRNDNLHALKVRGDFGFARYDQFILCCGQHAETRLEVDPTSIVGELGGCLMCEMLAELGEELTGFIGADSCGRRVHFTSKVL
jgi:hypothetical protein